MLRAGIEVVGELGYGGMSVARVTRRAGVSRRTFYEFFEDRDACFLAVFEEALATVIATLPDNLHADSWPERVRVALAAMLGCFDEQPAIGSLLVVDALAAGPRVLAYRASVLQRLIAVVDEGRGVAQAAPAPPLTSEGIVGAVLSVVHARILAREQRPMIELLNPLMGMIVLPYLGHAGAAKELERAVPKVVRERPSASSDPLEGLGMRLTYRTLRVLAAIAAHPGASNRRVAEIAGVHDQGQISKLLTRIEGLGLIVNAGQGHAKGESNAWTLTPRGQQIECSLTTQERLPSR
jgi:AcrR family transcriptional regulator